MINVTTKCTNCCFLTETEQCSFKQYCYKDKDDILTPGFCRLKRNNKYKNIINLEEIVIEEISLDFTLIVLFNENKNTIEDLKKTIMPEWIEQYCDKIIIMDNTLNRSNILMNYHQENPNIKINFIMDNSNFQIGIKRFCKNIKTKYFMVIEAGSWICYLNYLDVYLRTGASRAMHWYFPTKTSDKISIEHNNIFGLYITKIFDMFSDHTDRTIKEQLKEFASNSKLLSELFMDCKIINEKR